MFLLKIWKHTTFSLHHRLLLQEEELQDRVSSGLKLLDREIEKPTSLFSAHVPKLLWGYYMVQSTAPKC